MPHLTANGDFSVGTRIFAAVLTSILTALCGCDSSDETSSDSFLSPPSTYSYYASPQVVQCGTSSPAAVYVLQRGQYWCWAACVETVFRHMGVTNISQEQIVQAMYGQLVDARGDPCAAFNSLNLWRYGPSGVIEKCSMFMEPFQSLDAVASYICQNQPVILGILGNSHVVVAYAIKGMRDQNGMWTNPEIYVFDPIAGFQAITAANFMQVQWQTTYLTRFDPWIPGQ